MSGTAERALVILPRKYQGRLHHGVYRPAGTLLIGGDANDQNLPEVGAFYIAWEEDFARSIRI